MNMETRVAYRMNDRILASHELDYTAEYHAEALILARDDVGFAHVPEKDQSNIPLEVTVDFNDVPLTTLNDYKDTLQLRGLDDMTVVDNNDAMREVDYELMETVDNNPEFQKAIRECSMGQLFLIMQEIKMSVDNRNKKD